MTSNCKEPISSLKTISDFFYFQEGTKDIDMYYGLVITKPEVNWFTKVHKTQIWIIEKIFNAFFYSSTLIVGI